MGYKKAATLCILHSTRGYLLLRRSRPPHAGKYVPVGGKLDPHESPLACALREVQEEAGLTLPDMTLRGVLTETSPADYNWIVYVFAAEVASFDPPPCAEGVLMWVLPMQLMQVPTPQTDHYIYDYVARGEFFVFDAHYDAAINLLTLREEISRRVVYSHTAAQEAQ